jgi:poly-gamma-glutamate synthesis protein (capsule biosynthesis protein)
VYDTVTVTSAGDAVLGGDQRSGKAVQNPKSYQAFRAMVTSLGGDAMVFDKVKAYFEGDTNFSTLNLEGTLTLKDTRDKKKPFVFQGDPNYARTMLKVAGIDAVNLANNHTYDVGKDGYNGTIRALSKPDIRIQYYGNGTTAYVTKSGVKVAFLGYVSKGVYMSKMRSEIRAAAKKADVVVVHFHWTDVAEFKYAKPTSRQQYLARYAINNGADLVTGEHTHRVSGIERYRGRYIVYDLGNFVTMASNPVNQFGPTTSTARTITTA